MRKQVKGSMKSEVKLAMENRIIKYYSVSYLMHSNYNCCSNTRCKI